MTEQDNISAHGNGRNEQLSEERLMAYLEGRLTAAEQHEVEQWLNAEGMEGDAIEGLRSIAPGETRHSVSRLNRRLHQSLHKSRRGMRLQADYLTWIAIGLILFLAVVAYIVIRKSIR